MATKETDRKELKAADHEPLLRPRGSFRQVHTLDDTIDPAKIDAVLEAGVLNLTLHRKEAVKPRKINVRS